MTRRRPGATDDPVADWGPDSAHGLFDGPESSASGEVTGHDVTAGRAAGDADRPVAVLAWIGATLTVAAGNTRGTVPALEALVCEEPLDLLPGGFFPLPADRPEAAPHLARPVGAPLRTTSESAPSPGPDHVFEPDGASYSRAPSADVARPPIAVRPSRDRPAAWEERALFALLLGVVLLSVRACS